jgi:hypothetical protein
VSGPIQDRSTVYKDLLRERWVYSIKASGSHAAQGRTRRYWQSAKGGGILDGAHWTSWANHSSLGSATTPVQWMGSDLNDQPLESCSTDGITHPELYNFDAVAYESVLIGLPTILTGKRCTPAGPYGRGGEQDAVYLSFSRDGFNFQRAPDRRRAFLPMAEIPGSWNSQNVQSVGGGFLVVGDQLRFFVGARSGTCRGVRCSPFMLRR